MDLPSRNAIDENFIAWLDGRLTEADGRPILLRGTTDTFCAGLNLRRVLELDGDDLGEFLEDEVPLWSGEELRGRVRAALGN